MLGLCSSGPTVTAKENTLAQRSGKRRLEEIPGSKSREPDSAILKERRVDPRKKVSYKRLTDVVEVMFSELHRIL